MREIRTYGSMSGDGKRVTALIEALAYPERGQQQLLPVAYDTAPVLDSTVDRRKMIWCRNCRYWIVRQFT